MEDNLKVIIPQKKEKNKDLVDKAHAMEQSLIECENILLLNMEKDELEYTKPETLIVSEENGVFLRDTLYATWLYKSEIYRKIRLSSDNCCYCYVGPVEELDHFFNKNNNPELSVCTANLVPSCGLCNKKKTKDALYIQPYFEDIHQYEWLRCKLTWNDLVTTVPIPQYYVEMPDDMSTYHFNRLNDQLINTSFFETVAKKAGGEISSNWYGFRASLRTNNLRELLYSFCVGKKEVYGVDSWQYALYRELLNNYDKLVDQLQKHE